MTAGNPGASGATEGNATTRSARRAARPFSGAGRLRDGTPVRFRPLVAEDRDLLLAGFTALSGRSRRSRFLRGVSDAQFERMLPVLLDTVDQQSHVALLLYADGRPIGVGRLRRFPSDPSVADLAVTIADDWHGRGGRDGARASTARPRRKRPRDPDCRRPGQPGLATDAGPARPAAVGLCRRQLRCDRPGERLPCITNADAA